MNGIDEVRPCPSCAGTMRHGEQEETVTYQGESLTYLQPGWHCEVCGDGIIEGADNEIADAALHEVMARAKNSPISPLLVRAAREAVGLSQREAGRVFGGGPTAFYKYETVKAVPSEGMANLLRVALDRPDLFRKPADAERRRPHQGDVELLRKGTKSERLGSIVRRVYREQTR